MRADAVGLFWEDLPSAKGKAIRPMPEIPDTGWTAPTHFPDLSNEKIISIDCETYDPDLKKRGPGWARGVGHLVGVSVGAPSGGRWYFPIRHEIEPETNMHPESVLAWLSHALSNPQQIKVGANILYDVGWLRQEGVLVRGKLLDVQYAEALLYERIDLSLESMAQRYLGEGKESNDLYVWCSAFYGGKPNPKQRANIYRAPPRLVGPYAESDADLPLRLIDLLYAKLKKEELWELFDLECRSIPLLCDMRYAGVRVDVEKAERLSEDLAGRIVIAQDNLNKVAGSEVVVGSNETLARAFDAHGLAYGRTSEGMPSFTKDFLNTVEHPLVEHILEVRRLEKLKGTFVDSYILDSHVNGRVYCQFHPLRGDDGGTRSGRFASSNPNLQNIPSRDEELAPLVRGLFVPDFGHPYWRKYDYSQIEYRFLVHYAIGPGSEEARQLFCNKPDTDYHDFVLDMVAPLAGWDISTKAGRKQWRRPTKNINFGLIFGMGIPKLTRSLGLTPKEGKALFKAYHEAIPYAQATMDQCSQFAKDHGYVTTILGRRSRFDLWGPAKFDPKKPALPFEAAVQAYGYVERAFTHKALNRRLQGSAADLIKKAMLDCYEDGIFDVTGVPRLQVHDELNFSDPGGKDEAFKEMEHRMETAIPLSLPVLADGEIGPDWGHVE